MSNHGNRVQGFVDVRVWLAKTHAALFALDW